MMAATVTGIQLHHLWILNNGMKYYTEDQIYSLLGRAPSSCHFVLGIYLHETTKHGGVFDE